MSHAERQAFLKTSRLGQLLEVAQLLPEVGATNEKVLNESSENLPTLLFVSRGTFRQEVLESSQLVLVEFWASWCGLSSIILPLLQEFQLKWSEQVKVVRIDADENLKLANIYRLKSLPTLLLFEGGKVVHRLENFQGRDDLRVSLENMKRTAEARVAELQNINDRNEENNLICQLDGYFEHIILDVA